MVTLITSLCTFHELFGFSYEIKLNCLRSNNLRKHSTMCIFKVPTRPDKPGNPEELLDILYYSWNFGIDRGIFFNCKYFLRSREKDRNMRIELCFKITKIIHVIERRLKKNQISWWK